MDRGGGSFQRDGDRPDTRAFGPEGGHLLNQFVVFLTGGRNQSPALGLGTGLAGLTRKLGS
jgi:hypothetical protein